MTNLDPSTLLHFVRADFESAWDAVALQPDPRARCNFMFGKQAMVLLELACRICQADRTGGALVDFSRELARVEPRYFANLPGPVWAPSARTRAEFALPSTGGDAHRHVLAGLFNLIRNGQAHQYQQMRAVLVDGTSFWITLTGPLPGLVLADVCKGGRPRDHLSHRDDGSVLWVTVRPEVLFLDLCAALDAIQLATRGLVLRYLVENRKETFAFDRSALLAAFEAASHLAAG